jgi:hypothetical protein
VVCMHFEFVAMISFIGLYVLLMPGSESDLDAAFSWVQRLETDWQAYVATGLWVASIALIEPLYVAAGFALYLNRRTALEGWDLEVQLRSLAQRSEPNAAHAAPLQPVAAWLLALSMVCGALSGFPDVARAQTEAVQPSPAQQQIKEVLKDPVFGTYERRTRIQSLHPEPKSEVKPDISGFAGVMRAIAQVLRVAIWVALGIALLFALRWLLSHIKFRDDPRAPPDEAPEVLFGLDVRPESLPRDVAAAALAHVARGELVAALSLLYRGALVRLLHRDGIELSAGDTEADCLAKVRPRVDGATHGYLGQLITSWQAAAYAHRIPPPAAVEELVGQWRALFGTSGG